MPSDIAPGMFGMTVFDGEGARPEQGELRSRTSIRVAATRRFVHGFSRRRTPDLVCVVRSTGLLPPRDLALPAPRVAPTGNPMRVIAVVEIPPNNDETGLRLGLLRAAYHASRSGPVVLLVPPGGRKAIDHDLNPVVASNRSVHGVIYGDACDGWIWQAAGPTTLVVGSSSHTRARAGEKGAMWIDLACASTALDELNRLSDGTRRCCVRATGRGA